MMFLMILSLWALILCPSREAWAQKSLPTVRIGIEAVAGTNSHYYVTCLLYTSPSPRDS